MTKFTSVLSVFLGTNSGITLLKNRHWSEICFEPVKPVTPTVKFKYCHSGARYSGQVGRALDGFGDLKIWKKLYLRRKIDLSSVSFYPFLTKFVQYVIMSLVNLISWAEYSLGFFKGRPNVNSNSSPCFEPLHVGQGSLEIKFLCQFHEKN